MITKLKELFASFNTATEQTQQHTIELAAASLMVELARADLIIDDQEMQRIIQNMQSLFNLSNTDVTAILDNAHQCADDSTSTYEFTKVISGHFDAEQRIQLIEALWRVAYADGELDKYEEHFIRKVNDLLYVSHSDFIRAKHAARNNSL